MIQPDPNAPAMWGWFVRGASTFLHTSIPSYRLAALALLRLAPLSADSRRPKVPNAASLLLLPRRPAPVAAPPSAQLSTDSCPFPASFRLFVCGTGKDIRVPNAGTFTMRRKSSADHRIAGAEFSAEPLGDEIMCQPGWAYDRNVRVRRRATLITCETAVGAPARCL